MSFCQPCRELVRRHRKAARWAAFFMILAIFFTLLGLVSEPVTGVGFCRVYP
jgi:hypothetical protein